MANPWSRDNVGEQRPLLSGIVDTSGTDLRANAYTSRAAVVASDTQRCLEPGAESWREWFAERLESRTMHKFVLSLTFRDSFSKIYDPYAVDFLCPTEAEFQITIDALCVLVDLSYTVLEAECSQSLRGSGGMPPHALMPAARRAVSGVDEGGHPEPIWLSILAYISLGITTLFVFEIPLALWCFGLRYYAPFTLFPGRAPRESQPEARREAEPRLIADGQGQLSRFDKREHRWHPFAALHFFDAFVVLITFILETVLHGPARELAGLLIVLRLWRLVKLVGGVAVGAGELAESLSEELEAAHRRIAYLERKNATLGSHLVFSASS